MIKVFMITASLLVALNALACGGSGKDKEEEKEKRTSVLR